MAVKIFEVDGVEYAVGTPDPKEIEGDLRDPNEPADPDGWRQYSDVMTPEQIEYLRRHPRDEQDEAEDSLEASRAKADPVPLPKAA